MIRKEVVEMYAYPYGMNNNMQQQLAQNATLISTLRPTPIPAYQTCSPYESAQLFSHYGTACNNGCGC